MLSIDDVIRKFQKFKAEHGNIQVCKVGHYGEISEMDEFSFSVRKVHTKNGRERIPVVDVYTPDIGPEPD
jgi:hypothetical protein